MITFKVLKIKASEHTTYRLEVAAWEVPVVTAVHTIQDEENDTGEAGSEGISNVEEVGEFLVDRTPPNATEEFRRLANKYKRPDGSDVTFAAAVYGQFGVGVRALARAIAEATVDGEASAPPDAVEPPQVDLPAEPIPAVTSKRKKAPKAVEPKGEEPKAADLI